MSILRFFYFLDAKHDDGFLPITKQRYETPAPENLFTVNEDCEKLPKTELHRPGIEPGPPALQAGTLPKELSTL